MQGNPLGRKFKALVCHDGVFSTLNQYASEELFFPIHDFGGTLWENREGYEKWDPASRIGEWATPQLVCIASPCPVYPLLTVDLVRSSTTNWITACPSPKDWPPLTSYRPAMCRASSSFLPTRLTYVSHPRSRVPSGASPLQTPCRANIHTPS